MSYARVSSPTLRGRHTIIVPFGETVGFDNEAARRMLEGKTLPEKEIFRLRKFTNRFPRVERIPIEDTKDLYLAVYIPKIKEIKRWVYRLKQTVIEPDYLRPRESLKAAFEWSLQFGINIIVTPIVAIHEEGYDRYEAYDYLSRTCVNFSNHHEEAIIRLYDFGPVELIPETQGKKKLSPFKYVKVQTAPPMKDRHPQISADYKAFYDYFSSRPYSGSPYDFLGDVLNYQASQGKIEEGNREKDSNERTDLETFFRNVVREESDGSITLRMLSKLKTKEMVRDNKTKKGTPRRSADKKPGTAVFGTVSLHRFIWILRALNLDSEEARYVCMRVGIPWSDFSDEGWFFYQNLHMRKLELCDQYRVLFGQDLIPFTAEKPKKAKRK